jgi:hypothetical protein
MPLMPGIADAAFVVAGFDSAFRQQLPPIEQLTLSSLSTLQQVPILWHALPQHAGNAGLDAGCVSAANATPPAASINNIPIILML